MEAMREAWTDERLDDLRDQVDRRFDQVDTRFDRVDRDIRDLRVELKAEMNVRFEQVDSRFDRLETRFDSMQRMMIGAYVTAVLGFIFTQL